MCLAEGEVLCFDFVVCLFGGGCFVIDSKVVLMVYFDVVDVVDEVGCKEVLGCYV